MSNWEYANKVPTDPWRSAMTLPRELALQGNTLVQSPIERPTGFPELSFTTNEGTIYIHETSNRYIEIGVREGKLFLDSTHAWNEIPAPLIQEIPVSNQELDIRVIVDRGSIEVFAAGGKISITNLIFVDTALTYVSAGEGIKNLRAKQLYLEQQD
jgi:sucrose-6-phosphate hydrolase SacC (GH32 family)